MFIKKSLGQHFLTSKKALSDLVQTHLPQTGDIVLEIGPGKGALTREILATDATVIAIEKDRELIPLLNETFQEETTSGKLVIIEQDILSFDPEILKKYGSSYQIIANIPYYITGAIIRYFLESAHHPTSMTLLMQKEVAERIVAKDKKHSLLSLSVWVYGTPKYINTVPKGAFTPPPDVLSAVLSIGNISHERFSSKKEQTDFFTLIHIGFAHKRKTLIHNLAEKGFDKAHLETLFEKMDIPAKVRAEDLHIDTWFSLIRNGILETHERKTDHI